MARASPYRRGGGFPLAWRRRLMADVSDKGSKPLRDQFQHLRTLAARVASGLLMRFCLDRLRHGFVEDEPHGFVAGEQSLFNQRPQQYERGAERRHRISRVLDWFHLAVLANAPCHAGGLSAAKSAGRPVARMSFAFAGPSYEPLRAAALNLRETCSRMCGGNATVHRRIRT